MDAVSLVAIVVSALVLVATWRSTRRVEVRLEELERVGVLMVSDREAGVAPRHMTPREKLRFLERRINGTLSATA